MKRCQTENKEWEMEPFLLDIITPYLKDTVLDYMDFIHWHCTCKTVWRYLEPCLYNPYLASFIDSCTTRNKRLYIKLPHIETYKRLNLLSVMSIACVEIQKVVLHMTKVTQFNYAQLDSATVLFPSSPKDEKKDLDIQQIDVINLMAHYIKEKYGWQFALCRHNKAFGLIPTPLKTGVTYEAKDLKFTLIPGLLPFNPLYYSVMSTRKGGK